MWVQSLGLEDPLEEGMDTPVFLPREFHGQRTLAGCSPWGCKESSRTEVPLLPARRSVSARERLSSLPSPRVNCCRLRRW